MAKKKFDKEVLLKNRFWIVLGVASTLVVLAWLMLMISGSSAGDALQAKFNSNLKTVEASKNQTPKNNAYTDPWRKYGETFTEQKEGVWRQAWDKQATMYTWPSTNKARFDILKDYKDDVGPDSNQARLIYATNLYAKQFEKLDKEIAPVEFKDGEPGFKTIMAPEMVEAGGAGKGLGRAGGTPSGMPSLPGGGGTGRGPSVPGMPEGKPSGGAAAAGGRSIDTLWPKDYVPTMEEIWLAQEDFWVKREMLNIIRTALNEYSHFQEVEIPKEEPLPEKVAARHRFRNPTWEITLLIEDGKGRTQTISPRSTIKNISATRRTQLVGNARTGKGLKFTLHRGISEFALSVEGEPLPHGAVAEFKKVTPSDSFDFHQPFEMEQVLDWATSPIRRIDELRTAKNSHRLSYRPLKFNEQLYKEPEKDTTGAADKSAPSTGAGANGAPAGMTIGGPTGGGGGAPAMPGQGGSGGGVGGAPAGSAASGGTPNGLERERYLLTNPQCRHLPIAMVLIVDQAAVNDVLVAVANSRLRIQITQVALVHVHDPGPTPTEGATDIAGPAGVPPQPGVGKPPFPGTGGPVMPGSGTPGTGGATSGTETQAEDNNLFELTVYGVATLYERFQDKTTTPSTPSVPTPPK